MNRAPHCFIKDYDDGNKQKILFYFGERFFFCGLEGKSKSLSIRIRIRGFGHSGCDLAAGLLLQFSLKQQIISSNFAMFH